MDWLTGGVGAVLGALITVGISLYVWRKTRRRKRIKCAIDHVTSLLSISETIKQRLGVTFDNLPVSSVFLFRVGLINSGDVAIRKQPLVIQLAEGSTIVDTTINTVPKINFGEVRTCQSADKLTLEFELLNRGDQVEVEILSINNPSDAIEVGLKNEDVEEQIFRESSISSVLNISSRDIFITSFSAVPFFGRLAQTFAILEVARRLDQLSKNEARQVINVGTVRGGIIIDPGRSDAPRESVGEGE